MNINQTGTISATGVTTVSLSKYTKPAVTPSFCQMSIYLNSTYASRLIQISFDGVNYFTPTMDVNTANQLAVSVNTPITSIQFTAASGDTWGVL